MTTVKLRDVLQSAQSALEAGRYQEAIVGCDHAREHYPDAITALRLLGESYLEAGRTDDARQLFERVLTLDPYNVLARIGLAVIAEDRGEEKRAISQFRLAWELDPTLPQLRDELLRLYRKRFGPGGRLHLTRVALANLHARNEALIRAIREFLVLRDKYPTRPDLPLGLAEVLWRRGNTSEAEAICRQVLETRPQTARALLILADITGTSGHTDEAEQLLVTARGLDPDAELARTLARYQPGSRVLAAFIAEPATVPAIDLAATVAAREATTAARQADSSATVVPTEPLSWEAISSSWPDRSNSGRGMAPLDSEVTGTVGASAPLLPRDEIAPFDWAALPTAAGQLTRPASSAPLDEAERLAANWENIDAELAAARPTNASNVSQDDLLGTLGDENGVLPFDMNVAPDRNAPETTRGELGIDPELLDAGVAPFSFEDRQADPSRQSFADLLDTAGQHETGRPGFEFDSVDRPLLEAEAEPVAPTVAAPEPVTAPEQPDEALSWLDSPGGTGEDTTLSWDIAPAPQSLAGAPVASAGTNWLGATDNPPEDSVDPSVAANTEDSTEQHGEEGDLTLFSDDWWTQHQANTVAPTPPTALATNGRKPDESDARRDGEHWEPRVPEIPAGDDSWPASLDVAEQDVTLSNDSWSAPSTADADLEAASSFYQPDTTDAAAAPLAGPVSARDAGSRPAPVDAPSRSASSTASIPAMPATQPPLPAAPSAAETWEIGYSQPLHPPVNPPVVSTTSGPVADDPWVLPPAGALSPAPVTADLEPLAVTAPSGSLSPSAQQAALERRVDAEPHNAMARLMLAIVYSEHQPERALTEYRRLIRESPTLIPEIIERLHDMVAEGKGSVQVHRLLSDAYLKRGEFDLAAAEIERALTARQ